MKTYLEPEEVKKLEDAAGNLRDKLLIRLLFFSAARVTAVLAIAVDVIDFDNRTITIKHLKESSKLFCPNCKTRLSKSDKYCRGCSKKIGKATRQKLEETRRQILPIDSKTLGMLKEYIARKGPVNSNGKLVIFGFKRSRAAQIIKTYAEKAGLPKLVNPESGKTHNVSPHRLRDAFAVNAIKHNDSGDGIRMLQEHLGHQGINTTMRYRKVSGEEHRQWYDNLWGKESGY